MLVGGYRRVPLLGQVCEEIRPKANSNNWIKDQQKDSWDGMTTYRIAHLLNFRVK